MSELVVKTAKKKKVVLYAMGAIISLAGLGILLYWMFADSSGLTAAERTGDAKKVISGSVFVNATSAIGTTDENYICATLDWWPPEHCDFGNCSWGEASLLNIVKFIFVSLLVLLQLFRH